MSDNQSFRSGPPGRPNRFPEVRQRLVPDNTHLTGREPGKFRGPINGVFDEADLIDQPLLNGDFRRERSHPWRAAASFSGVIAEDAGRPDITIS